MKTYLFIAQTTTFPDWSLIDFSSNLQPSKNENYFANVYSVKGFKVIYERHDYATEFFMNRSVADVDEITHSYRAIDDNGRVVEEFGEALEFKKKCIEAQRFSIECHFSYALRAIEKSPLSDKLWLIKPELAKQALIDFY